MNPYCPTTYKGMYEYYHCKQCGVAIARLSYWAGFESRIDQHVCSSNPRYVGATDYHPMHDFHMFGYKNKPEFKPELTY